MIFKNGKFLVDWEPTQTASQIPNKCSYWGNRRNITEEQKLAFNDRIGAGCGVLMGTRGKNQQLHKWRRRQRKLKVIAGERRGASGDTVPSFPAPCLAIPAFSLSSFHSVFRIDLLTSCPSVFSKSTRNMTTWQKYGCFGKVFAHDFCLLILILFTLKQLRAKVKVKVAEIQ